MIGLITALVLSAGAACTTGPVETVQSGFQYIEGPLWMPGTGIIFSDIPADSIFRVDKTVFRKPSHQSNGLTLDPQGRLVIAENKNRRVVRIEADGSTTVLADHFQGKRFNSPNDVIVRSDGSLYFTDPPYGLEGGLKGPQAELDFAGVFLVTPKGEVNALARDFSMPNGLALSPNEKTLYVSDSERHVIRAFDVATDGSLANGRDFFNQTDLKIPDGLKVDRDGRVWATGSAIWAIAPSGELLQKIDIPEEPSNCAFGDADYKSLYVTAVHGLYKVRTTVAGIAPGPGK